MALNLELEKQLSLMQYTDWRTTVSLPQDHQLLELYNSIPWESLMEKAKPILYDNKGISPDIGRRLNLRAHLGAYILQTVHCWTDRWTEEMIRFYIPARIFCGFTESIGSLDRTSIEDFRNRFGTDGAQLITQDMIRVAKEFGFTSSEDIDMDTTVAEAGITHPTEMKLLRHLFKKGSAIHKKLTSMGMQGLRGIKSLTKAFTKLHSQYRFFAKDKVQKNNILKKSVSLGQEILEEFLSLGKSTKRFKMLSPSVKKTVVQLNTLGPVLMNQITHWVQTGKVANDKIISLWKQAPKAISKGKVGKPVEFGRKWIINSYQNGYVTVVPPEKVKQPDQHCVVDSLNLHFDTFNESPKSFGADRGMWSEDNVLTCLATGIDKVALQPKGKTKPLVSPQDHQKLKNRRASIEPRIGHLKKRGLGKSKMKSDYGDLIAGHRSAISYNLTLLMKNLTKNSSNYLYV